MHVLGERGAWRSAERQHPPYRPHLGMGRRTSHFFLFFCPLNVPSHVSRIIPRIFCTTALLLLYYRAHILASWVVDGCFFVAVCCAVLLLYYILPWYGFNRCTGWLGGSVHVCVHGFGGFIILYFLLPLYRLRGGKVRRTIIRCKFNSNTWKCVRGRALYHRRIA